jgi:hypothetical protein
METIVADLRHNALSDSCAQFGEYPKAPTNKTETQKFEDAQTV